MVCHDFTNRCNRFPGRLTDAAKLRRRKNSLTDKRRRELGLDEFARATEELYGTRSALRAAAAAEMRAEAIKAAAKILARPVTMRSVMVAIRAVAKRKSIAQGAPQDTVDAAAKAVWRLATAVPRKRDTHASLSGYAKLFTATIVSKAGERDLEVLDRTFGTAVVGPVQALAARARIPGTDYARLGIPCRAMSKLWRDIKGAA